MSEAQRVTTGKGDSLAFTKRFLLGRGKIYKERKSACLSPSLYLCGHGLILKLFLNLSEIFSRNKCHPVMKHFKDNSMFTYKHDTQGI